MGRWQCSSGSQRFAEIVRNEKSFLWKDNEGSYPATLSDDGRLIVHAGLDISMTIDSETGELICPIGCGCNRFRRETRAIPKTRADIIGTFVRKDDPDEYLELKENGTLFAVAPTGDTYPGTWTVNGDTITIKFAAGETARAQIEGNTLILNGVVYVKK